MMPGVITLSPAILTVDAPDGTPVTLVTANGLDFPTSVVSSGTAVFTGHVGKVISKVMVGPGDWFDGDSALGSATHGSAWMGTPGQSASQYWPLLADNSVGSNALIARSVIAGKIGAEAITTTEIALNVLRKNLVSDASFEEPYTFTDWSPSAQGNTSQWRRVASSTTGRGPVRTVLPDLSRSGSRAAMLYAASTETASMLSNTFPVLPGQEYRLVIPAASLDALATMTVEVLVGPTQGGLTGTTTALTSDTTWTMNPPLVVTPVDPALYQNYSYTFTPAVGETWAAVRIANASPATASTLLIDDVSVVEVGVGGAAELTAAGLRLFDDAGFEVTSLVSNRSNYYLVQSKEGGVLASIDADGKGTFSRMSITGIDSNSDGVIDSGLEIYGTEFTEWIAQANSGCVAFAQRDTSSITTTTTEQPYLQLDFAAKAGRLYKVSWSTAPFNDTTNGRSIVNMRYTTDGTAPQITSTLARTERVVHDVANTTLRTTTFKMFGNPTLDRDYRILLSYRAELGTVYLNSSTSAPTEIIVEDLGPWIEDTGIDRTGAIEPSPPATRRSYTTTWTSTGFATYQGSGARKTNAEDVKQGYSSYDGDAKGLWIFPSMTSALSGATITKVEVYLYANHWYYNSGGTALIDLHDRTSIPSNWSSVNTTNGANSANWPKPGGRWVTMPSSVYAGLISGALRGVAVGPAGTTNLLYYGRFNGAGAKIRISYWKNA